MHVPLNVHDCHWLLLVFNFDKEELQVLNSNQAYRDEAKETALVSVILRNMAVNFQINNTTLSTTVVHQVKAIQSCIDEAVAAGLVTPKPINITEWKTRCYTNIPKQKDGYELLPKILLAYTRLLKFNYTIAAILAARTH